MKYLLLLMLLIPTDSFAIDCSRHKIYCKIVKINSKIDKKFAMELSNIIYRKAKKYKINPMISVAIAAQESSIRNINRYSYGVSEYCVGMEDVLDSSRCLVHKVVTDVGIFQIHVKTALNYDIDIFKLIDNIEYQVESHMQILRDKLRMCKKYGSSAWTCYHSTTPKHRKKYKKMVSRFL